MGAGGVGGVGGQGRGQDAACPVWVLFGGKQYCSPALEHAQQDVRGDGYVILCWGFPGNYG